MSIGSPEKMEPITKVSHIPSSRWALVCSLCNEKFGASIQVRCLGRRASFPFLCCGPQVREALCTLRLGEEELLDSCEAALLRDGVTPV